MDRSNDNGISIIINDTLTNVISQKDGLAADSVRCITQSTDGDYYVGTTGELSIVTLAGGLSVKSTVHDITYARCIDADSNGDVAVVTDKGLLYLLNSGRIINMRLPEDTDSYTCCRYYAGKLYVGTSENEIQVYSTDNGELVCEKKVECDDIKNIKSLCFSEDNTMFICADNGIAYFGADGKYEIISAASFNSSIDHMLIDYQGNLWFTSSRLGIMRMCKSIFKRFDYGGDMGEEVVNSTAERAGLIYVGTDSGLVIFDSDSDKNIYNTLTDKLTGVRIRCVYNDEHDNLWICTSGKGIYIWLQQMEKYMYMTATMGRVETNSEQLQHCPMERCSPQETPVLPL